MTSNDCKMDESARSEKSVGPEGLAALSKAALRRVRALKKLQLDEISALAEFHKRVHTLTLEMFPRFKEIRSKVGQLMRT